MIFFVFPLFYFIFAKRIFMKIVLLGYMGSGKSTVGRLLAQKLATHFLDLDAYIEAQEQATIKEIFASKGELYFRKKEHEYLQEVLQQEHFVLALGGGTPCYSQNMEKVLEHTEEVFYLKLSIPALAERLQTEKANRPLIQHLSDEDLPEFIGKHLFERSPFYNLAPNIIKADNRDTASIVDEIIAKLG